MFFFFINRPFYYDMVPASTGWAERMREIWVSMQDQLSSLLSSMIISGIIGIVIFTPLTLLLGRRLKSLQTSFIIKEYRLNNDFNKSQRTRNQIGKPSSSKLRIISWADFV